jgi:hypothetical protein
MRNLVIGSAECRNTSGSPEHRGTNNLAQSHSCFSDNASKLIFLSPNKVEYL